MTSLVQNIPSKVIKVTCALIEHNDKILIAQRSESMHLPLKWEFPGGKVEPFEKDENCLVREIEEELNLIVVPHTRLTESACIYGDKTIVLIPFLCRLSGGNLAVKEHKEIKWVFKAELWQYDWAEADVPIVKEYFELKKSGLRI